MQRGTRVRINGSETLTGTIIGEGQVHEDGDVRGGFLVELDDDNGHGHYLADGTAYVRILFATANNLEAVR